MNQLDLTPDHDTILEEWRFLSGQGMTLDQVAAKFGILPDTLATIIGRHRRAGK